MPLWLVLRYHNPDHSCKKSMQNCCINDGKPDHRELSSSQNYVRKSSFQIKITVAETTFRTLSKSLIKTNHVVSNFQVQFFLAHSIFLKYHVKNHCKYHINNH